MEVYASKSRRKRASPTVNRLIWGDNLPVMDELLREQRGSFQLIYADPPFATGKGFQRRIGSGEDSRQPKTWKMGSGYSDSWNTIEDYLSMLYPAVAAHARSAGARRDALSPSGLAGRAFCKNPVG